MMRHKFQPGDRVTMVNDHGAVFPGKTILTAEITPYGLAYKIEPTDCPWFPVPERNLFPSEEAAETPVLEAVGGRG